MAFALKFDDSKRFSANVIGTKITYFYASFLGYCIGLFCAMMAVNVFK